MIHIILDKELDYVTFNNFFHLNIEGVDFGEGIKRLYPDLTQHNYREYIDQYYTQNTEELETSLHELQAIIQETQESFFAAVKELFNENFREHTFRGALSIFNCNPRYLEQEIFQVYYKKDTLGKLKVTFHEVLHFIFFMYCDAHYPHIVSELDKNNGPYWSLSEIFNVLVLNRPEFRAITQHPEHLFYPSLQDIYPQIERIWNERENMEQFVETALGALVDT